MAVISRVGAAVALVCAACAPYHVAVSDAPVDAAFSEVLSQYASRERLVPPLIDVLDDDVCARGRARREPAVCRVPLGPLRAATRNVDAMRDKPVTPGDAGAFRRFETVERQLADALTPVLDAIGNDARLTGDPTLQQLGIRFAIASAGIAASRARYDEAVRDYNAASDRAHGIVTARLDRPVFTVPDRTPARPAARTDFDALKGSLVV